MVLSILFSKTCVTFKSLPFHYWTVSRPLFPPVPAVLPHPKSLCGPLRVACFSYIAAKRMASGTLLCKSRKELQRSKRKGAKFICTDCFMWKLPNWNIVFFRIRANPQIFVWAVYRADLLLVHGRKLIDVCVITVSHSKHILVLYTIKYAVCLCNVWPDGVTENNWVCVTLDCFAFRHESVSFFEFGLEHFSIHKLRKPHTFKYFTNISDDKDIDLYSQKFTVRPARPPSLFTLEAFQKCTAGIHHMCSEIGAIVLPHEDRCIG